MMSEDLPKRHISDYWYTTDPYGSYYAEPRIMFPVEHQDDRMHPKEIILGLNLDDIYKAYKQNYIESNDKSLIQKYASLGKVILTENDR